MRTALVTGSAGFIGAHMVETLIEAGWWVVGVDTADPHPPGRAGVGFPECELVGGTDCRHIFADPSPPFDLIVHCAAVIGGRVGIERDPLATTVNLSLDVDMFRWALRTKQRRVVYFSSSAVYPVALQGPESHHLLTESDVDLSDVRTPDALYGWSKLTGELIAGLVNRHLPVHILRPFSGYGDDQSPDYPFRAFIDRAIARVDPFPVWGSGTQRRDWVHVDDICATVLALIAAEDRAPINVGWGVPVSFDALARLVSARAGYRPELEHVADAPAGVAHRVCDPGRLIARRMPKISLMAGVDRALSVARARA